VLVDGWLKTGDRGWLDAAGHLHLVGRSKNMIVTEGGKNVYPEDVEGAFEGVPCEELVVYAADYLYPRGQDALVGEQLVLVVRVLGDADEQKRKLSALHEQLRQRNQRLPDGKRIGAVLAWETAFPRTASMKIKRDELATTLRTATARTDLEVL
jgi:long-chain acyl-CoA synthetase